MELFTVKRYDETKLNAEDEKLQEELILQQLQARKEKKAKRRASKVQSVAHSSEENEDVDHLPVEGAENERDIAKDKDPVEGQTEPEQQAEGNKVSQLEDFIVLGGDKLHRLKKTDEVLPPWLSHPTVIDSDLSGKGPSIKKATYLDEALRSNLKTMGYERLFPVQEKVIPWILGAHAKPAPFWPRDVCISSPTGSGKTLAFAVPIVQLLLRRVSPAVRALIILPVQELAEQVYGVFAKLCHGTKITPIVLSRKQSFQQEQAKLVYSLHGQFVQKTDIVVTTAGRLVEHLHSTAGFTLRHLRFLVIDEADRVMNQIQNDWLYHLNKHVKQESDDYLLGRTVGQLSQTELFDRPRQPHKLLFSATLSRDPEKLQTFKLFHPKLFTAVRDSVEQTTTSAGSSEKFGAQNALLRRGKFIGQYTTPAELRELVCYTQFRIKPLTLFALIRQAGYRKFLVFTNNIDASHRLSFVLQRLFGSDMVIEEWSSSLSPTARRSVLHRFSLGKVNGIICTDALARGFDIDDIEIVVSYDMPRHISTYIHRIGRTARAGNRGTSITLLIDEEKKKFKTMLTDAGKEELETIEIQSSIEEEYAGKYSVALNDLRDALELEKQIIAKIRNGLTIASLTHVNLLSKLKDRVHIDSSSHSSEVIKALKHLPKSWTNEAIEIRAEQKKNRKRKHETTENAAADTLETVNVQEQGETNESEPTKAKRTIKKERWRNTLGKMKQKSTTSE
ncbi:probable ATP-dependent RNA helicase Dbp73D [Anopheles cruzii]|uniref:probable ATP-dependent RNA helicase Dbp73D n=1 Tax=Anopheles cruzii TaxID=68878 RepID=UPI0022EC8C23|nr:probable ATP-dependent RNA helicase Dbp73D [Anopheles cruzii]